MDLINLMLEVPETIERDKLETFLQGFSFAIKNEPVDLGRGSVVYTLEGPRVEYSKFEAAVKQEKGYIIWSNPGIATFGPPK